MHLTREQVDALDEDGLRAFLDRRLPEGLYLEYKSEEPERREAFLREVTALANASGGLVVLGVKEPGDDSEVDDLLCPLTAVVKLASKLESWTTDCVEPRLSGVLVKPVPLGGKGRGVVVCYVPVSHAKPHAVREGSHFRFYVRGSEQSAPMTYQQVRDAFLYAATSRGRAEELMREFEEEIREGMQSHRAVLAEVGEVSSLDYKSMTTLLLQAVPLTPLEPEWPIHTERRRILRPLERSHAGLAWGLAPPRRLTMSGMELRGHVGSSRSPTLLAFHCTGQVAATLTVRSSCQGRDGQDKRVLEQEQVELILKYLEVCDLALEAMETDVPYLLQCKILEANGLFLEWSNVPYRRTELRWPIVVRDAGHSFTELYRDLRDRLYFAFDLELSK